MKTEKFEHEMGSLKKELGTTRMRAHTTEAEAFKKGEDLLIKDNEVIIVCAFRAGCVTWDVCAV